jgi:hypothetical protein
MRHAIVLEGRVVDDDPVALRGLGRPPSNLARRRSRSSPSTEAAPEPEPFETAIKWKLLAMHDATGRTTAYRACVETERACKRFVRGSARTDRVSLDTQSSSFDLDRATSRARSASFGSERDTIEDDALTIDS